MGRSDGLGTDGKAIQPETEGFEDVASNTPSISFQLRVMSKAWFPGRRCFPGFRKAAGVGQPFEQIFDFQLPIAR
jgi:hypothetical protein